MGDTLTGTDSMSLETMALIAGAVVVCLALIMWFVKRRGHMIFMRGGGNRQPRLAVLDAAAVDSRRRLVLVRRDHVEHLILIGGPSDIVVESGIGRSAAAQAEKAKQAAKAAAKAAAKSSQEKRSGDDPAVPPAQPVKSSPAAITEQPKPTAKQITEKKPADGPENTTAKAKSDNIDDVKAKPSEPKQPQRAETAPVKPAPVEKAVAVASVVAAAAVNGNETADAPKMGPEKGQLSDSKPGDSGSPKSDSGASEPSQGQTIKNEFEDALEAARDLVMPEDSGETASRTVPDTQANYAHAVPAPPESIDPVPAPPPPAAETVAAPAPSGPIAAAADELIADFDRVLEAEMGRPDTKKVVEFEQAQPKPANPDKTAEKHDVASLEDEMKKLLGDLSVKQ